MNDSERNAIYIKMTGIQPELNTPSLVTSIPDNLNSLQPIHQCFFFTDANYHPESLHYI
jgi:hypothetical protein